MSRKRSRSPWKLANLLPDDALGIFPEDSIAFMPITCPDLEHRMQLLQQQLMAMAALNKALLTLGRPACDTLVNAIDAASREGVINSRQANYLRNVNKRANEAKHFPIIDEELGNDGSDPG